ncbi:hypothetical protein B0T21DRAFT_384662 [Apiosordaria backusii]|uniref:NodB homology domain-containing protein n=1 Tax=Apiosordaria backusii TaxID=314023 RepID=A0AA40BDP6_9PEZI|nr:hypothetical protein B0T21DRAFT_384662 [Apiosordaria backusii]
MDTVLPMDVRCGPGLASCPSSSCCSRAGYCGYSAAHRGAHCQVGCGHCEIDTIRHRNTIALTFDDGPSEQTGPLLDLLRQEGVKATFFLASHTCGHLENLDRESQESRNQQMMWNEITFRDILGFFPTYMRPPHGNCQATALFSDELWNPNHSSYGRVISLAHDTLPATLNLARHMISQAKARNLHFVTVGQCLGDWDRANWYRDGWTGQRRVA